MLLKLGKFAACAESCTAGAVAAALAGVPGASKTFSGGVVAYQNSAKIKILGVSKKTISEHTEVSPECALEMAEGALKLFPESGISVSTTGFLDDNTSYPNLARTAFIGIATRKDGGVAFKAVKIPRVKRHLAVRLATEEALNLLASEIKKLNKA